MGIHLHRLHPPPNPLIYPYFLLEIPIPHPTLTPETKESPTKPPHPGIS